MWQGSALGNEKVARFLNSAEDEEQYTVEGRGKNQSDTRDTRASYAETANPRNEGSKEQWQSQVVPCLGAMGET